MAINIDIGSIAKSADGIRYSAYRAGDAPVATPSITNVTGTLTQGSTLTVSGSGFGSKTAAAPYYYNNMAGEVAGTRYDAMSNPMTDFSPDGRGYPEVTASEFYSQSRSLHMHYKTSTALGGFNSMFPKVGLTLPANTRELYYSARVKYTHSNAIDTFDSPIFKWARAGSSTAYSGDPAFRNTMFFGADLELNGNGANHNAGYLDFTGAPGGSYNPGATGAGGYFDAPSLVANQWHDSEYTYLMSETAGGLFEAAINNEISCSVAGTTAANSSENIEWLISHFDGNDSYNNHPTVTGNEWHLYVDEIYVDTTRAKVFISDSPTWSGRDSTKQKDLQIPATWSATSLTVSCNIPSFTSGTVYMYVMNENGIVNETGYSLGAV